MDHIMTSKTPTPFGDAVKAFEKASPWLAAPHAPALATLRVLATMLDTGDVTPALVAQFGLTYRSLAKVAPTAEAQDDPLEAALKAASGG